MIENFYKYIVWNIENKAMKIISPYQMNHQVVSREGRLKRDSYVDRTFWRRNSSAKKTQTNFSVVSYWYQVPTI